MLNQSVGIPITIRNSGAVPYMGTAVGAVPCPQGVLYGAEQRVAAVDAMGNEFMAAYDVTTTWPDGSVKWALLTVSGTFPVGHSQLYLRPIANDGVDNFIPENFTLLHGTRLNVRINGATTVVPFAAPIGNGAGQYKVLRSNACLMEFRREVPLTEHSRVHITLRALRGEKGVRFRTAIINDGNPHTHATPQPLYIEGAGVQSLRVDPAAPSSIAPELDIHCGLGAQLGDKSKTMNRNPTAADTATFGTVWFNQIEHAWFKFTEASGWQRFDPLPEARLEHVMIRRGAERAPLWLGIMDTNTIDAVWLSAAGAVPQGGRYSGPMIRPGNNVPTPAGNPNTDWDVNSTTHCTLNGGNRFICEGFLGFGLAQQHLDVPVTVTLTNVVDYAPYIVGGLTPTKQAVETDANYHVARRGRIERLYASNALPSACDNVPGLGRITERRFRERGGTYADKPLKENPHYGYRDFGDNVWADGYTGANHYDMCANAWWQWLRNYQDPAAAAEWLALAIDGALHLQTVDFIQQNPLVPVLEPLRGRFAYEKGHSAHGVSELPTRSHEWCEALIWQWLWQGDFDAKECLDQFAENLQTFQHLDGAHMPALWAATHDQRNWGAQSQWDPTKPEDTGHVPAGWYGDSGIRVPGRILENLVKLDFMAGIPLKSAIARVVDNVMRVESEIWGKRGIILNRDQRAKGHEDHEQPWMHFFMTRGVGYALQYALKGHPIEADATALYQRFVTAATHMWFDRSSAGNLVCARPWSVITQFGAGTLAKFGCSSSVPGMWTAWRLTKDPADWSTFLNGWTVSCALLIAGTAHPYPAWVRVHEAVMRVATAVAAGTSPDAADLALVDSDISKVKRYDGGYGIGTNYSTLLSDVLAQALLNFGRNDLAPIIEKLVDTWAWHHQDGGNMTTYPTPQASPSRVGYRMEAYPGAETKIWGAMRDTRYALAYVDTLAPADAPYVPILWLPDAPAVEMPGV